MMIPLFGFIISIATPQGVMSFLLKEPLRIQIYTQYQFSVHEVKA
jgi:hypothetical protein